MHFITIFLASFLWWNLVTSVTIISSDRVYNDLADDDVASEYLDAVNYGVSETMYMSQKVGKSHRFFLTVGERKEGDVLLDHVFKQTGSKTPSSFQVNVTYPPAGKIIDHLTYIMMTVYQGSDENRINVIDGGEGKPSITLGIHADSTKYVAYKADFYGFPRK